MNKEDFLYLLSRALNSLPSQEVQDILADYRMHFDESAACGRSEEATAESLGDPVRLGRQHLTDRQEGNSLLDAVKRVLTGGKSHRGDNNKVCERMLVWQPGSSMSIDLPLQVNWRPAEKVRAVLRGPAPLIEHIHLENVALRGRFKWQFFQGYNIELDLEGPAIESWMLRGSGVLCLHQLSQEKLNLHLDGSGDIKADGEVDQVTLSMMGSGDIDLSALRHARAIAHVKGSGDARLAPSEEVDLCVEGYGDIHLLSQPTKIKTRISGGGDICTADGRSLS